MKRLLGIGECMVELSAAGDDLLRQSYAGDVFNTLWYARAALDETWSCEFYSAIGTDPVSQQMLAFMQDHDIGTGHILRIADRRPGLYMIHLDGAERSFSYWRESSAARLLARDREALDKAVSGSEIIYFSGITLAILPKTDAEFLLSCAKNARNDGKIVAFDPNIRPALWPDPKQMRTTIQQAAECASVILPSYDDEKSAFGDRTPGDTLARYGALGATVVLKNGHRSVEILSGGETASIETEEVNDAVDTTGAGDSFNGAFLAAFARHGSLEQAVRAGQICAASVIRHPGALVTRDKLPVL